jgi:hypothetical protein
MKDNHLPQMETWSQQVATIRFGEEVSNMEFDAMTDPLFQWSRTNQCRFFVRVIDATLPNEKGIYKSRLRTVEGHFYKFLVLRDDEGI